MGRAGHYCNRARTRRKGALSWPRLRVEKVTVVAVIHARMTRVVSYGNGFPVAWSSAAPRCRRNVRSLLRQVSMDRGRRFRRRGADRGRAIGLRRQIRAPQRVQAAEASRRESARTGAMGPAASPRPCRHCCCMAHLQIPAGETDKVASARPIYRVFRRSTIGSAQSSSSSRVPSPSRIRTPSRESSIPED